MTYRVSPGFVTGGTAPTEPWWRRTAPRLNVPETTARVAALDDAALAELGRVVMAEAKRRVGPTREEQIAGYTGLSNFMAGVTRALCCRAALRASKGHPPFSTGDRHTSGGTPTGGEMWTAAEGVRAYRDTHVPIWWRSALSDGEWRKYPPSNARTRRSPAVSPW